VSASWARSTAAWNGETAALMLLHELGVAKKGRRGRQAKSPWKIEFSPGHAEFYKPEAILKRPELLIRIFEKRAAERAAQREASGWSKSSFTSSIRPIAAPGIVRAFERILQAGGGRQPAEDLRSTGFPGGVHPEFRRSPTHSVRRVPPLPGRQAPVAHGADAPATRCGKPPRRAAVARSTAS